jgi:hypothetical protein
MQPVDINEIGQFEKKNRSGTANQSIDSNLTFASVTFPEESGIKL